MRACILSLANTVSRTRSTFNPRWSNGIDGSRQRRVYTVELRVNAGEIGEMVREGSCKTDNFLTASRQLSNAGKA